MTPEETEKMLNHPVVLSDNPTLEQLNDFFENDRFATQAAGCRIVEGGRGHSVVEMPVVNVHLNAQGHVMGGAIFTLADFALAVASVTGRGPCVSASSTIEFLSSPKADRLIATAHCVREGRRLSFYEVNVMDGAGRAVAKVSITAYSIK